jgi:hypothetical protein
MRSKGAVVVLLVVVVASSWWFARRGRAADRGASPPAAARQGVELTVYAQDFGMVRELRPLQLARGSNRLRVLDVSKQLDPHSVLLRWQGESASQPRMVAHSYDLGVDSSEGLLKRYLGREVELVRYGENGRESERQRGTLMVQANGEVVLQTDGRFYVGPVGTVVAPTNGDIVTIPQLSVQAESPAAQAATLDVAYLTRGLSWSADYVATLSPTSGTLTLECWATVTNRTSADYPNAKVMLMAGMPNRAALSAAGRTTNLYVDYRYEAETGKPRHAGYGGPAMRLAATPATGAPQEVGDAHAYPIKDPTTIVQEQMNRLLMLSSAQVPVTRDYSAPLPALTPWDDSYLWGMPSQPQRGGVQVALSFFNRAKAGLGLPLPQGAIRIYEPDRSGSLRYAGAATIENTPKDQKVQLTLARAFDLFTESRIVRKQRVNRRTVRKEVEVVVRNEKPAPAEVRVVQGFGGRWKVVREARPHVNLNADHAQWRVRVPSGGKAALAYTVDLTE